MGHYRSEMGFEGCDAEEHRWKEERRAKILSGVEKQLAAEGAAAVIADLLMALGESRVYVQQKWEHHEIRG